MAPEHAYPAALEDCLAALRWVWEHGPDGTASPADHVVVCGDSAGGGLALSLLNALHTANTAASQRVRRPSGVATLSAYTDVTCSLQSYTTRVWNKDTKLGDPVFTAASFTDTVEDSKDYLQGQDPRDPNVSPVFMTREALEDAPPLCMVVGDAEVMMSDTLDVARRALAVGGDVTLRIYPRMWHCFPMYIEGCGQGHDVLLAGINAINDVCAFVERIKFMDDVPAAKDNDLPTLVVGMEGLAATVVFAMTAVLVAWLVGDDYEMFQH